MEIKVSVDGIERVVCGVTEMTTCQEVVIALAQARGKLTRCTTGQMFENWIALILIKTLFLYTFVYLRQFLPSQNESLLIWQLA